MGQCNFCSYQNLKRTVDKSEKISKFKNAEHGGVDIFVHPHDLKIDPKNKVQRNTYFRAWYMKLPKQCAC